MWRRRAKTWNRRPNCIVPTGFYQGDSEANVAVGWQAEKFRRRWKICNFIPFLRFGFDVGKFQHQARSLLFHSGEWSGGGFEFAASGTCTGCNETVHPVVVGLSEAASSSSDRRGLLPRNARHRLPPSNLGFKCPTRREAGAKVHLIRALLCSTSGLILSHSPFCPH